MVRSRSRNGWRPAVIGIRTAWRVIDDGEFFCSDCGGDRCYQQLEGRRRLTILGAPVLVRGPVESAVRCAACRAHFPVSALDAPTTGRLSTLLRDAVHTIALVVLAAGGECSRTARESAVDTVRAAGYPDCSEERLLTLLAALSADEALELELREVLTALTPQLAASGRESLLLAGARIALADGPYSEAERAALSTIGGGLLLCPDDTERLLATAAPS